MIHLGKNTTSRVIAKSIAAGKGRNSYRGLIKITKNAENACNFSQCDSLLIGGECATYTFPCLEVSNASAQVAHEATTTKIGQHHLLYCNQRGISNEKATALIVNGYCKEVLAKLPMEFAVEGQKLLALSLKKSVG
jgi:Fe-S cluster assembly protein SufB